MQKPLDSPTVLSEAELSTDESCTSEESGPCFKNNEFGHVFPMVRKEQTWADELVELAREAHSRHSLSSMSSMHEEALEDDETVLGTETRSAGTPISTTGTITPRTMRSRANSTVTSPRTMATSPQTSMSAVADAREVTDSAVTITTPTAEPSQAQPALTRASSTSTTRSNLPSISEKSEAPTKSATTTSLANRHRRGRGMKSVENLPAVRGNGKLVSRNSMLQMLEPLEDGGKRDKSKAKKKKSKIIFTVGDMSDEEENKPPEAGNDDDEWASEDEEEEERRRAAEEEAEKRQRAKEEEAERLEMFKKRPIRSVSLADLNMVQTFAQNAPHMMPAPEAGLTRGLLSSIFQPAEGQRRGSGSSRPAHAGRTLQLPNIPSRLDGQVSARNTSVPALAPARMTSQHGKKSQGPNLERSKSVIALPLLDLTSLRSSTASARGPDSPELQSHRDEQGSVTTGDTEESQSLMNRTKSSNALARLSAIAQRKSSDTEPRGLASLVRSYSAIGNLVSAKNQVPPSPTLNEEEEGPSLAVQAEDTEPRVARVPQPELEQSTSDAASTKKDRSPNPNESVPVPLTSPHTTRQNMLSDELSESLKQNLLWERQSRARILGLDASMRPTDLDRRASSGSGMRNAIKKALEDESFHHKGW
ncbi:hypothetical protein MEQU1_001272 [Malassezia equina]|uniref:DUF3295 domain-containing protein n=1 Tax=Malassezia equina TaxID=1381935 RepID=A0AAF0J329_9BASI|nr:hypothetical protein MEQU1_001272 [Malassezia equina]